MNEGEIACKKDWVLLLVSKNTACAAFVDSSAKPKRELTEESLSDLTITYSHEKTVGAKFKTLDMTFLQFWW